jgi:hypothetical protein
MGVNLPSSHAHSTVTRHFPSFGYVASHDAVRALYFCSGSRDAHATSIEQHTTENIRTAVSALDRIADHEVVFGG